MNFNYLMNLNLYRTFYFVATSSSFKEASVKLYMSQPAISKQMKELEDILGVKLFTRFNKGIELTKTGRILFEQLEKANFYLKESINQIEKIKDLKAGELIIGCPSHITSFYLLDKIKSFKTDYGNIEIKVVNGSTSEMLDDLHHHKIDFMVDFDPIDNKYHDFKIEVLDYYETVLIANYKFDKKIKSLNDLINQNFVLPLPRSSVRKNFEKILLNNSISINVGLDLDTTDLIISAVKKNFGIGYVIRESVKEELKQKTIKELKLNYEFPKLKLNLVYNEKFLTPSAKVFIDNYIRV